MHVSVREEQQSCCRCWPGRKGRGACSCMLPANLQLQQCVLIYLPALMLNVELMRALPAGVARLWCSEHQHLA